MFTTPEENGAVQGTESVEVTTAVAPKKKAAPKKAAKKAPAKKAAAKKADKKVVAKKETKEPLRANSIAEAIKLIKKSEQKLGVVIIGGKKYSFTHRNTWCVSKNLLENGEAGLIMIVKEEGHFVYPAKAYKELFGNIMKTNTWKNVGNYSQSVLPQWHSEYFTPLK